MSLCFTLIITIIVLAFFDDIGPFLHNIRCKRKSALIFLFILFIGMMLPDIKINKNLYLNTGMYVIPLMLSLFLFIKNIKYISSLRIILLSGILSFLLFVFDKYLFTEIDLISMDYVIMSILAAVIIWIFGKTNINALISSFITVLLYETINLYFNLYIDKLDYVIVGNNETMSRILIMIYVTSILFEISELVKNSIERRVQKKKGNIAVVNSIDNDEQHQNN